MDGNLRSEFRTHIKPGMWVPVETGMTDQGVPDSWYALPDGVSGWIEFKLARGNVVKFRPMQPAWLGRCSRMGTRCFVAVKSNDKLLMYRGSQAFDLRDRGISATEPVGSWIGGPRRWDWVAVRSTICMSPPTTATREEGG